MHTTRAINSPKICIMVQSTHLRYAHHAHFNNRTVSEAPGLYFCKCICKIILCTFVMNIGVISEMRTTRAINASKICIMVQSTHLRYAHHEHFNNRTVSEASGLYFCKCICKIILCTFVMNIGFIS